MYTKEVIGIISYWMLLDYLSDTNRGAENTTQ